MKTVSRREAATKINFTVVNLARVQSPPEGRVYIYDQKTPGLALCVTAKGSRTFYVYRRVHGRPQRIRLGKYPPLTIEQARDLATRVHAEITYGADPNADKKQARCMLTLEQAFERLQERIRLSGSATTLQSDSSRFNACLSDWSTRKLNSVRREEVIVKHAELGKERGKTNANRAVQLLRRIYNHASKTLGIEIANPASKIPSFGNRRGNGFCKLPSCRDSSPRLRRSRTKPSAISSAWRSGPRRGNVMRMRWEDINLAAKTWTIPAEEFKTKRPLTLPLSAEALAILERRKRNAISEWVFPSRGKTGHLVEPKTAWDRICKRAGLANLRIHDLRRTLGSWQAALGASLPIIGRSLGHVRPETTQIYARLNLDPVRESVNAATAAILAASKTAPGDRDV